MCFLVVEGEALDEGNKVDVDEYVRTLVHLTEGYLSPIKRHNTFHKQSHIQGDKSFWLRNEDINNHIRTNLLYTQFSSSWVPPWWVFSP